MQVRHMDGIRGAFHMPSRFLFGIRSVTMAKLDAGKSGSFKISGKLKINRLGFGAMRVTGPGIFGPPEDMGEALRTLKPVPELGIDFIDTADSYGPDVSEQLIRKALHPYKGVVIATKAGLRRPSPDVWDMDGRPEYLRKQALESREQLGVEAIDLWQLHRIDPKVPRDEQFAAVKSLLDDGVIHHAGLSEVSVADIKAASKVFPVATVRNRYNLVDRGSEDVLDYCEAHNIGIIPRFPLASGDLAKKRLDPRRHRPAAQGDAEPDRSRLGAEAEPCDAADSRHLEGQASRGERRRGGCRADGRGVRRARQRGSRTQGGLGKYLSWPGLSRPIHVVMPAQACSVSQPPEPRDEAPSFLSREAHMKNALIIGVLLLFLGGAIAWAVYAWNEVGDVPMSIHGYIAMALGIFFSLLIGGVLMGLVFYSSRSGYDEPTDFTRR
jgi:pyridoxine 4-dehydrogenase